MSGHVTDSLRSFPSELDEDQIKRFKAALQAPWPFDGPTCPACGTPLLLEATADGKMTGNARCSRCEDEDV